MESIARRKSSDRATIQPKTLEAIEPLTQQLENEFKGMLKLKRDDVVNIILSVRCQKLTPKELEKIRREKLTNKQRAKWLLKQVQLAEQSGQDVNFDTLVKQIQSPEKGSKNNLKKPSSPTIQGVSKGSGISKT